MIDVRSGALGVVMAVAVGVAGAQTELDLSACAFPDVPAVPDGNVATADEMIESGKAVRDFNAVTEENLACLDEIKAGLGEEITVEQVTVIDTAYNAGVDQLTMVVEAYNMAVRAYKAKNPPEEQ